jgi:hypothetical protein
MAQSNRTRALLAGSIAFVAVPAFLGSTPAHAQFVGPNLREANAIAQLLADAESARLNGNCAQRDAKLTEAQTRIAAARGNGFDQLTEEGQRDFYVRLAEARARPCPPPGPATTPPPPVGTVPPTGTTSPPPDSSIMDQMDDAAPAPPAPTPTPVLGPEARRVMNQVERDFTASENARVAGRCAIRDEALNRIGNAIDAWAGSGVIDAGLIDNWRRRLAAARALPCPLPGPPAPPPAQVGPDLRTGDAGSAERLRRLAWLGFEGGFGSMQIPRTNYGFVADGPPPDPEFPALFSAERPGGFWLSGEWETGRFGAFSLTYARAEASNHVEIAAGPPGSRRGWPYTALSPSGSAGLSGNVGMEVDTEARVEAYRIGWSMRFGADPPAEVLDELRASLNGTVGITASYRDRDHHGTLSITTPVIATQTFDQDVDELELGVNVGIEAVVPFSADVRLRLGAQAGAYYYDYDLRSVEHNVQNFGPAADRDFTTELRDSIGNIAYAGDAIAAIEVDLSPSAILFLSGEAAYFSDRAQVLNPPNGTFVQNGGTSALGTDDAFDWRVGIGLRIGF